MVKQRGWGKFANHYKPRQLFRVINLNTTISQNILVIQRKLSSLKTLTKGKENIFEMNKYICSMDFTLTAEPAG